MRNNVNLTKGQEYLVETLEGSNKVELEVTFEGENHGTITFKEKDCNGWTISKDACAHVLNLTQANAYTRDTVNRLIYTVYLTNGKLINIYEKNSLINTVLQLSEEDTVSFKENKELDILMMNVEDDHDEAEVVVTKKGATQIIEVLQLFVNRP